MTDLTVTRDGGRWIAVRTFPIPGGGTLSITSDATPAPGEVYAFAGDGVTIVRRTAPRRPGCVWAAPFAANCDVHGWIVSRRTPEEAAADGRAHIAREHGAPSLSLSLSTDHGAYDVLPAREPDEPPAGATHTVFGDGGYLAGYASQTRAWDKRGRLVGSGVPFRGIAAAAQYVTSCDL